MVTMGSLKDKVERRLWTAEEFLDWLEPGKQADLIEGQIYMRSPVNFRHADRLNFLDHLLRSYLESHNLGRLYREVVAIRLSPRQVFLPDLAFFTHEQVARLTSTYAPFAPTWVTEALSPHSVDLDLGLKFAAYEAHGVQEYWVLDPEDLAHRFFQRQGELLVEYARGEEMIRSHAIPGFWVQRNWLNPEQLPPVTECLERIKALGT
jgi:Uma2 family endonuclease